MRASAAPLYDDAAVGATVDAAYTTNDPRKKLQHKEGLYYKVSRDYASIRKIQDLFGEVKKK